MTQANDNASRLASRLSVLVAGLAEGDPMDDAVGFDTSAYRARAILRDAEQAARDLGYASLDAGLDEIERRTSGRWLYFSGLDISGLTAE